LFDSKAFRKTMSQFATGVTLVTTTDLEGNPFGMTINSFSSVSLDPPMILFCAKQTSIVIPFIKEKKTFCVNVLNDQQSNLAIQFARRETRDWNIAPHTLRNDGTPLINNALAHIYCRQAEAFDAGDHKIIIGAVVDIHHDESSAPLLYHRSQFL